MLPAAAATVVSWLLCQLGAYQLAKRGDVTWFRDIAPSMSETIPRAVWDLFTQIWATWAITANEYDKVQWNLFFLLKASMFVYIILLATTFVTSRARKMILFLYYLYSWTAGDGTYQISTLTHCSRETNMSFPT